MFDYIELYRFHHALELTRTRRGRPMAVFTESIQLRIIRNDRQSDRLTRQMAGCIGDTEANGIFPFCQRNG